MKVSQIEYAKRRALHASINICTEGIRCCGVEDVRPAAVLVGYPCLMPLESHAL